MNTLIALSPNELKAPGQEAYERVLKFGASYYAVAAKPFTLISASMFFIL